ncbi:MAG: phosphocholine cytidylyltransferase family protein [Bacteroidota bacterium]|jgi:phosphoenolpyruvate phosphomutase
MKAIILAAGEGTRLHKYTKGMPKCMLSIGGVSIIERQIDILRDFGIDDIIIVRNKHFNELNIKGVRYYMNNMPNTNMVYSLFCAEKELDTDLIITYGDILYDKSVIKKIMDSNSYDISVVVDMTWIKYYTARFTDPYEDAESLVLENDGRILNIGEFHPSPEQIQAQYIGVIKLSKSGSEYFNRFYNTAKEIFWNKPWIRNKLFQQIYMTDYLQAIIDNGIPIYSIPIEGGWLEFDTEKDYENVIKWHADGTLRNYCSIEY